MGFCLSQIQHIKKKVPAPPHLLHRIESTIAAFWLGSLLTLRTENECVKPQGYRGLA